MVFIIIHLSIQGSRSGRNTAGTHYQNTLLTGLFQHRKQILMNVAIPHTGMNNTLIPIIQERSHDISFYIGITVNDTYFRQLVKVEMEGFLPPCS